LKEPKKSFFVQLRLEHPVAYDLVSMAFYVLLVYGLGCSIGPMGRDFSLLADPDTHIYGFSGSVLKWITEVLGRWSFGYHLISLLLMYACMVLLFFIVRNLLKTPYWIGTLASVLFMANPAYGETLLNLTGMVDLIPCLAALVAFFVLTWEVKQRQLLKTFFDALVLSAATFIVPSNALLPWVFVLFEFMTKRFQNMYLGRSIVFSLFGAAAMAYHWEHLVDCVKHFLSHTASLYFLFYPIGLTPETAYTLHRFPVLGFLGAGALFFVIRGICKRADSTVMNFSLIAALITGIVGGKNLVDPVHLVGAGKLLLASAFYHLGFVALVARILQNPRWRITVTTATTILCVVYFAIQINQVFFWRTADAWVKRFQTHVQAYAEGQQTPIVICPDFRYFRGAPLCLSESISFNTPFNKKIEHVAILPLHFFPKRQMGFHVDVVSANRAFIRIKGVRPTQVIPTLLLHAFDLQETARVSLGWLRLQQIRETEFVLELNTDTDILENRVSLDTL